MAVLNDEKLEKVSGGAATNGRFNIKLTGPYWGTAFKENGPYTAAIGWSGLTAEWGAPKGTAPYRIYHDGVAIGFTVRENFVVL